MQGLHKEDVMYYSISKITSRVNIMDLLTVMEKTCKSPKDISILNQLLDTVDSENKIRIDNIKELAIKLNVARSKLNALLKAFENYTLFYKLGKGVYMVNAFIFVGKRVNSNALRETAQKTWVEIEKGKQ